MLLHSALPRHCSLAAHSAGLCISPPPMSTQPDFSLAPIEDDALTKLTEFLRMHISNGPSLVLAMEIFRREGVGSLQFLAEDAAVDAVRQSLIDAASHPEIVAANTLKTAWPNCLARLITAAQAEIARVPARPFDANAMALKAAAVILRSAKLTQEQKLHICPDGKSFPADRLRTNGASLHYQCLLCATWLAISSPAGPYNLHKHLVHQFESPRREYHKRNNNGTPVVLTLRRKNQPCSLEEEEVGTFFFRSD